MHPPPAPKSFKNIHILQPKSKFHGGGKSSIQAIWVKFHGGGKSSIQAASQPTSKLDSEPAEPARQAGCQPVKPFSQQPACQPASKPATKPAAQSPTQSASKPASPSWVGYVVCGVVRGGDFTRSCVHQQKEIQLKKGIQLQEKDRLLDKII